MVVPSTWQAHFFFRRWAGTIADAGLKLLFSVFSVLQSTSHKRLIDLELRL
jgi:hypothetical protein